MESSSTSLPVANSAFVFKETLKDVLSSSFGAACCVYTGQPFDTVKVRMQLATNQTSKVGITSILRSTLTEGGVRALWRGSTPAVSGQLAENSLAFAINNFLKRLFPDQSEHDKSFLRPLLTAGFTGACTAVALCPFDVIKCRAQANILAGRKTDVRDIAVDLVRRNGKGVLGLWRGTRAQILRDVPFYASFLGFYDILSFLLRKSMTSWSDGTVYFVAGGLAGQLGWLFSIVPDTIKSRIQVSDDNSLTIRRVFRELLVTRGVRGLFTGVEVALIRAFPANAALFVGYEFSRQFLSEHVLR